MNSSMAMAFVASSSRAWISSAEKRTNWSLEYSYPLTTPSRSTFSPSAGQMYCCFKGVLHLPCSIRKEMPSEVWAELKSLTGIETSPNDTVAVAMERGAAMERSSCQFVRQYTLRH